MTAAFAIFAAVTASSVIFAVVIAPAASFAVEIEPSAISFEVMAADATPVSATQAVPFHTHTRDPAVKTSFTAGELGNMIAGITVLFHPNFDSLHSKSTHPLLMDKQQALPKHRYLHQESTMDMVAGRRKRLVSRHT